MTEIGNKLRREKAFKKASPFYTIHSTSHITNLLSLLHDLFVAITATQQALTENKVKINNIVKHNNQKRHQKQCLPNLLQLVTILF